MQELFQQTLYNHDMAKVVSKLKELRERAGISQRELARLTKQDSSNISFWERSGTPPRSELLPPIAKALGVSVEELLGQPNPKRNGTPAGRMRQLFEAASKLPRRQQEKIIDILQPFVSQQSKAA